MNSRRRTKLLFWAITVTLLVIGVVVLIRREAPPAGVAAGPLVISELMASNGTSIQDEDGDYPDWIELHNSSRQPVNLSGYTLTDDPARPEKWAFPNLTLASDQYLIVFASGKNRIDPGTPLHTNFKLQKGGEFLGLYSLYDDRFIDQVAPVYPEQRRDVAFGRQTDQDTQQLYLSNPSPGNANTAPAPRSDIVAPIQFSPARGFYDQPVQVELQTDTPEATIRYTLDGTEPTVGNGEVYSSPIPVESSTFIRAAAFKDGLLTSPVNTHSYIFLDEIIQQPANPPGWPATWGVYLDFRPYLPPKGAPVPADYEMDPRITRHPVYGQTLKDDLRSIPSLSLVTEPKNFDIYIQALQRGLDWERPISIEWIDPANPEREFQVNAGIRMQGVSARWEFMPKKSFRLFFRGEYGTPRLKAPIFSDSPVDEFDTLVLRGGANQGYAAYPSAMDYTQSTYTRDEWLRASQIAISGVGSHGTFVHLYLNGLYWGLYNLVERPDIEFATSYYGGRPEDWFGIKHGGTIINPSEVAQGADPVIEMGEEIGGDNQRYEQMLAILDEGGLENPARYEQMKQLVDIKQFSDYIILNLYAGNHDWGDNNWYVTMRNNPPGPLRYFVWDGEVTWEDGAQLYLGKTTAHHKMRLLFLALMENPDFRLEFADRAATHLLNDGALTDENSQTRWAAINQQIERAIVAESARWGDARYSDDPVDHGDWLNATDNVAQQMAGNATKLINLLREGGYYPRLEPPAFNQHGGQVDAGFNLSMAAPEGEIFFTTDGSDPRLPGSGQIAPSARQYTIPLVLSNTTRVRARSLVMTGSGLEWSAQHEATFQVGPPQPGRVQITEIMYNPSPSDEGEYLTVTNSGDAPINLTGASFEGISYLFPPGTPLLRPGESLTLARSPEFVVAQNGTLNVFDSFSGQLSNGGETIRLLDAAGNSITTVTYDDSNGWPVTADGRGDSLILIDLQGDPNNPKNWRGSSQRVTVP